MERRKMAVIFLGLCVVILGSYAFMNQNNNGEQINKTATGGDFSIDGPATIGQEEGDQEWEAILEARVGGDSVEDKNNVTKNVAKAAFAQMKALDQKGASPFDDASVNTPEMQAAITSSLNSSVDSFYGMIAVNDRDIKISANNTKTAKISYLKGVEAVLARHPSKPEYDNTQGGLQVQIQASCEEGDPGINKDIANHYASLEKDFATVRVPSSWVIFHKKAIEYYRKGNMIFTAVSSCQVDPLKGIAAAQKLATFGMEATTIQNLLKKMYNEVGL